MSNTNVGNCKTERRESAFPGCSLAPALEGPLLQMPGPHPWSLEPVTVAAQPSLLSSRDQPPLWGSTPSRAPRRLRLSRAPPPPHLPDPSIPSPVAGPFLRLSWEP